MLFYLSLVLILAFTKGDRIVEDESSDKNESAEDNTTNDTFGVPDYSASNAIPFPSLPLNGKSYSYSISPAFPLVSLPAGYIEYLRKLGLSDSNYYSMFNRYRYLPYTSPALYRPLQSVVRYGSSLVPEFGYPDYNNLYFSRSSYPKVRYNHPDYRVGLGNRYLSLPPASLKVSPIVRAVIPVASVPSPIDRFTAPTSAFPIPMFPVSPYKAAKRPLPRKGSPLRNIYAPKIQAFPTY